MERLTISVESDNPNAQEQVRLLLETANAEIGYERHARHFCAVLRNADGGIEGGITAVGYWGWVYIADLAVASSRRRQGYGRNLLASAEAWGVECACHDVWLSTLSFQAREFYERAGYRIFAELPNFPEGQTRFFLRKSLL